MDSKTFLARPLEVASRIALMPSIGVPEPELRNLAEPTRMKAKVVDARLTVYSVPGTTRILFANIVDSDPNQCDIEFSSRSLGEQWFPAYWLPWYANKSYRITLKPPKDVSLVTSPRMFFTGPLDGCMVHVVGDPQAPTVYHSNAVSAMDKYKLPPGDRTAFVGAHHQRALMHDRVSAAERELERRDLRTLGSVDLFSYAPEQVARSRKREKKEEKARVEHDADTADLKYVGMVIGIRGESSSGWTFYYQAACRLTYRKGVHRFVTWSVREFRPFWPVG